MTKIAKLSLVAATAVVGFSTAANAQALEDAIKNVEVSGSVVYRYNDYNNDANAIFGGTPPAQTNGDSTSNNYKAAINLSSKVNDDVKFTSRIVATNNADSGFSSMNTSSTSDGNLDISLSNAYFTYTGLANTTVNLGKQGLTTPWTVAIDSDGNEQTGTGILAMTNVGPVTFAGAYFNQTNLDKSGQVTALLNGTEDIATIGAIGTLGMVTLDAWYLDMQDEFDSYTVGAKANFDLSGASVGVDARYASLDLDNVNVDNDMFKIKLTGKMGIFNAKVLYAMTNDEGGLTALDNDAVTTVIGWNTSLNGKADADYWQTTLGVNALSNLNISANYNNLDYTSGTSDIEEEELYTQITYKMSKNLTSYVRYGMYTKDNNTSNTEIYDDVRGRLQIQYTF